MIVTSNLNNNVQVEVLDALFEKCNLTVSNVSITEYTSFFGVYFELTELHGKLNKSIDCHAVFYALNGSILDKGNYLLICDDFLGFNVIDIRTCQKLSLVSKIRIYPSIIH